MSLLDEHEHLVLDCDGVVYVGADPVPGTAEVVAAARERGLGLLFVTNDTTRSAADIAAHIGRVGIDVDESEVLHAGRAAALHLAHAGAGRVLVLGTPALVDEISAYGVEAVRTTEPEARGGDWDALVVGQDAGLAMRDLKRLVQAWRPGMELLAVNGDRNYPTSDGLHVGCGAIAAAVAFAVDADFVVAGKPSPILFAEADMRLGPGRTAMLGDTLASDVAGANAAGWTSVWLRRPGAATDPAIVPVVVVDDPRDLL